MKANITTTPAPKSHLSQFAIATALILSVPLIAMMFTNDVDWNWFDFLVMGALLMGTGLTYDLLTYRLPARYRPVAAIVLLGAMLLIWAELAVGVFGSPFAGS